MIIKTSKSKFFIKSFNKNEEIPFFFLHGFTGSHNSWIETIDLLNKHSYAMDLPGHGKSIFKNTDEDYTISDWCSEFYLILHTLDIQKINLCAYSMGGRLAVAFASKYPEKINSLILESSNLGIEDRDERIERYDADKELSEQIIIDLPKFLKSWEKNDFFSNQKNRNKKAWEKQKETRRNQDKDQLAKSLKIFSSGNMRYYESQFQEFSFPISIINGSEDDNYIKIGKKMTQMNQYVKQYIIKDTMHNTHLESPELFVDVLNGTIYE
ncbi:MAG: hypothetical protein CMG66_01280 [Candidatus Marinimicrobia bacterium]|nr:hypothetical protein [Candidatus Neomarinimicrobiota bacterium]|tara:strand:+ start:28581 stop:29384 length:804 start_codon:yes stop_codon:yes gene_type:complete